MAQIKNCGKKMILTYSGFTVAVERYSVERKYEYNTRAGFNRERINIASGADHCKLNIFGTIYSEKSPIYAFDAALKNAASAGLGIDNNVFDNMALARYVVNRKSNEPIYNVELEFVSATSYGGPMNV